MPLSYAQYAGNGSTTTFSVPFPYLLKAHVKLYTGYNILSGAYATQLAEGTDYSWTSGTQIQATTAPSNGVTLTVLRDTPDGAQLVPWQDGSNLTADDFNNADLQNLYVVQEQQDRNDAGATAAIAAQAAATSATAAANSATTAANTANATAAAATTAANNATTAANTSTAASTAATATANAASTNAAAAVSTANTAASNASTALSTANTASSNASNALSTANTAASNASAAVSTANTAASNASTALSTANTAATNASTALSAANTAATNASTALSTANTASGNATTAVTTANTANNKADQAIAAVGNAVLYQLVANVAAIPGSPTNNKAVEIYDSTGIQSFTPLAGLPAGFTGSTGLSVRIIYSSAGSTWNYIQYFPNDPEVRYLKIATASSTYQTQAGMSSYLTTANASSTYQTLAGMSSYLTAALAASTYQSQAGMASYAPLASPTFTGTVTIPAGASISGYLTTATAASTYQTQAGMSSYLSTSAAGATYAPLASPTFTGTVTIPAGASISGYLTSATAASTYAPLASPTFTGTVTIPAGASISGYAALATAQSFTAAQRGAYVTLTDAATVAIDMSLGNQFQVTLGGGRTLGAPTNVVAGQSGVIRVVQDATGSRTLAYNSIFKFPGGTAPTLTTAANSVDLLAYHCESSTRIAVRFIGDVK